MSMQKTLLEKLNWRYAVKKFDSTKKIKDSDWKILEESLRLAPSSYGLQPWQFWIVQNPKVREELKAASWNQSQVTDCSHFVVLVYKPKMDEAHIQKYLQKIASVRGVSLESMSGYKLGMVNDLIKGPRAEVISHWAEKQTYIAMGMLMESAALLDIDTCPLEGLVPAEYNKILKLENTGWNAVAAVACGYRSADDKFQHNAKVRFDHNEVFKYILE